MRKAEIDNKPMTGIEARRIAEALGHDPLLIALHDLGEHDDPLQVIGRFVDERLSKSCRGKNSPTLTDCRVALRSLGEGMIIHRQIDPSWEDVREWLQREPDRLEAMRRIVRQEEVVCLNDAEGVERLRFRHDRVRAWLLSESAAELMRDGLLTADTIAEPFFAELIGTALAKPNTQAALVERARRLNPLALFYALKNFREPETEVHRATLNAIDAWLSEELTHRRAKQSLRWAALQVLAETESTHVLRITDQFKDETWSLITARFRNGDLMGGVRLCERVNPGATASWRDREIEHARSCFGNKLVEELSMLLKQPDLNDARLIGGLRLAGHLGEPKLLGAIGACWANDQARADRLTDYLWAAARCGGGNPSKLLSPICAAWAQLPDKAEQAGRLSPRDAVGVYELSWAFNEQLSPAAASYFVARARRKDLRWPITLLLRGVNQPNAVEFIARVFAAQLRLSHGYWHFPGDIERDWERRQSEFGKPMSIASRQRLFELWSNGTYDQYLRRSAFKLWSATTSEGDLNLLQEVEAPQYLIDEILWARMRRGDVAALPDFMEKLQTAHSGYWWQLGRYTWSNALTHALGDELQRRGETVQPQWGAHYESDWIVSELVVSRLTTDRAEELLRRNWEHLHFSRDFIEAALLVGTPGTCALVAEALSRCPDPRSVFLFVQSHFHPRLTGGRGIDRIEQAEAFLPYLDLVDSHGIFTLWETCNKLGWFAFRRRHLDTRLDATFRARTVLDEPAFFTKLDEHIANGGADWADFVIDRYLEQTDRVEDIIALLQKWLGERKTIAAFDFVAAVLRHIGVRQHLQLLSVSGIQPEASLEEIRADTLFAVSRRSLT